jgi:hypothetical protein
MKALSGILFLLLIGCGKVAPQKSSTTKQNVSAIFKSTELRIKVYYEVGAEPYISDSPLPFQYWTILEQNLKALFSGRKIEPQVIVPKTLAEMTSMPASGDTSWTVLEVENLAKAKANSSSTNTFQIFFLNGRAAEGAGIIGFHISGSNTIAIFKDVIKTTGDGMPLEAVPKYVEQSTLVHEMGHALGLVNNGLPMIDKHQDKAHGAHCSDSKCVMYWSNEGAAGLTAFAIEAATKGTIVMFDDKCLKDARSY